MFVSARLMSHDWCGGALTWVHSHETHSWGHPPSLPEALEAAGCALSCPYASAPLWSLVALHSCSSLGLVSCLGHPLLVPNSLCDTSLGVISECMFRELLTFRCFTFTLSLGYGLFPQCPGCQGTSGHPVPLHGGGSIASEPQFGIASPLTHPCPGVKTSL